MFSVDDVTVSITQPIDIDGIRYRIQLSGYKEWLKHPTGLMGLTLPASATTVGEYWTARVTPNDGHVDGVHTDVSFVYKIQPQASPT